MGSGIKLNPEWSSKRMALLDGRQVKCCTYDPGDVWIHDLDVLPRLVRRRLADARYNVCPTCLSIDVHNNGPPTLSLFFRVLEAIERTLDQAEQRFNPPASTAGRGPRQ
jgi:hypothetical protein